MALSYSALTNYGKASLPSVETWGTNNNILRDPPRSITTRRIDKVTWNSNIAQDIQDSGDRAAEYILAYPRGSNPMVGTSFANSRAGGGNNYASRPSAYLPYRVMDRGAFRPPILAPVDLLPLSRLPRNTTRVEPIVYKPDYTKKLTCQPIQRAFHKNIINACVNPTIYFKVDKLAEAPSKYAINDTPLKGSLMSNIVNRLVDRPRDNVHFERKLERKMENIPQNSNVKAQYTKTLQSDVIKPKIVNNLIHAQGFTNRSQVGCSSAGPASKTFSRAFGRGGISEVRQSLGVNAGAAPREMFSGQKNMTARKRLV